MLFNLLTSLIDQYSFLNVFKYLTFRTGLSVVTSLTIVFVIGGPLIKLFSEKMISGPIRNLVLQLWVGLLSLLELYLARFCGQI